MGAGGFRLPWPLAWVLPESVVSGRLAAGDQITGRGPACYRGNADGQVEGPAGYSSGVLNLASHEMRLGEPGQVERLVPRVTVVEVRQSIFEYGHSPEGSLKLSGPGVHRRIPHSPRTAT